MTFPLDSTINGSLLQSFAYCLEQMPENSRPDLDCAITILRSAKFSMNLNIGEEHDFKRCIKLLNGGHMPNQRIGDIYHRISDFASLLKGEENAAMVFVHFKLKKANLSDAMSTCNQVPDLEILIPSVVFFFYGVPMGSRLWEVWQGLIDQHYPIACRTLAQRRRIEKFSNDCKAACLRAGPTSDQVVHKYCNAIAWNKAMNRLDMIDSNNTRLVEFSNIQHRFELDRRYYRADDVYEAAILLKERELAHSLVNWYCELTEQLIRLVGINKSSRTSSKMSIGAITKLNKFNQHHKECCEDLFKLLVEVLPEFTNQFSTKRGAITKQVDDKLIKIQILHDQCEKMLSGEDISSILADYFRRKQLVDLFKSYLNIFSSHFRSLMLNFRECLVGFNPCNQSLSSILKLLIPPNQPEQFMSLNNTAQDEYFNAMLPSLVKAKSYFDRSQPLAENLKRDLIKRTEELKSWCATSLLDKLKQKEQDRDQYREFITSTHYSFVPQRAKRMCLSMLTDTTLTDLEDDDQSTFGGSPWYAVDRGISFPEPKIKRAQLSQLNFPYVPSQAKWFKLKPPLSEKLFPECQNQGIERQMKHILARSLSPIADHYVDRGFSYSIKLENSKSVEVKFLCATIQKDNIRNDGVFAWGLYGGQTCIYRKFIHLRSKRPFEAIKRIDKVFRDIKLLASEVNAEDLQSSAPVFLEDQMEYDIAIDELRAKVHLTSPQTPGLAVTIHSCDGPKPSNRKA